MNIVQKSITELVPYENNPRNNDEAVQYVAESIREFGFKVPIIIDKNNVIVAGHTRYKASKRLGLSEVPCVVADDLTEEQVKALRLADNKVSEYATWNLDKLELEMNELELDMELFGFEPLEDDSDNVAEEDDFEPVLPEVAKSKPGDIYKLGNHRLMCGDSTNMEDVERLAGGREMDMLLTDPPYNVAYEGGTKDKLTIQNDDMEDADFRIFLIDAFASADKVLKKGGAFYIWHADSEGYNFRGACRDVGWKVRQCLIWNKNSMVMGRQDYHWKHEPCLYGWKDGAGHFWNSDRKQTTVFEFDKPTKNDIHPTMKPIPLFDYQIKNNTKSGDAILDLFAGSGTTIMACEQNGREAYCMEYDPKYVDVIIKRWEEFTGCKAVLIDEATEDLKTA